MFTVIVLIAVTYLALYILLSVPSVQQEIKGRVEKEVSTFLGGEVRAGRLIIHPFNEVVLKDLEVFTPTGERCLYVETVGAGISLQTLFNERRIEITFGEIIGLDARIVQKKENAPLNIQFIIDAFSPKDPNKPPTKFDLCLRNVVIRRSRASFDKEWIPVAADSSRTDFAHLKMEDLRADINLPRLVNDDFTIDLRRLSFSLSGGLNVEKLAGRAHITQNSFSLRDFVLKLPNTEIRPADIKLKFDSLKNIAKALETGQHSLIMVDNPICPADFGWLLPELRKFTEIGTLSIDMRGNLDAVQVKELDIEFPDNLLFLSLMALANNLKNNRDNLDIDVSSLKVNISSRIISEVTSLLHNPNGNVKRILHDAGDINIGFSGGGRPLAGLLKGDADISSNFGNLKVSGMVEGLTAKTKHIKGRLSTGGFHLGKVISKGNVGKISGEIGADCSLDGKIPDGTFDADISEFEFNGRRFGGLVAEGQKVGDDFEIEANLINSIVDAHLEAEGHIEGEDSWGNLRADIIRSSPGQLGIAPQYASHILSARVDVNVEGNNVDNITGDLRVNDLLFFSPLKNTKSLFLDHLVMKMRQENEQRKLTLDSDWLKGDINGDFKIADLPKETLFMLSKTLPSLVRFDGDGEDLMSDISYNLEIAADNTLPEFFNLPFRLLVPVPIRGFIDGSTKTAKITTDIPYLQQGKNRLIRDSRVTAVLDGHTGMMTLMATSTMPAKRGEVKIDLHLFGQDDYVITDASFEAVDNPDYHGELSVGTLFTRNEESGKPEISAEISPSEVRFGSAVWNIDGSHLEYADNRIEIKGFRISHDNQFVAIDGVASTLKEDSISVRLADIDLDYIFETLSINYVSFGGTATGDICANGAFSREPVAKTDNLKVKNLSYNGSVLGDAAIRSFWDNNQKCVGIKADIDGGMSNPSKINGGIWVTRDSLSFDIDADRIPVGFMAPFMAAFSSGISGRASGHASLFGTFSDIDLTGRIFADSLAIKLDATNVWYHGSDSVRLDPGLITIPSFRLYDSEGHSAILSGELSHRYFHDPSFNFRVSDIRGMLCYDTNSVLNPDWYGTIYGNGNAFIKGKPGVVEVSVDMTATGNSSFTFVLNETQAAEDYKFLTFSDRRKEALEKSLDTVPDIISTFRKTMAKQEAAPTKFLMDIRASVTPSTLMTLVMDPASGDKITARGNGDIQVEYNSESNNMQMLGKYTLDEGNYNFSLQDLILRDFSIRNGSSISFNGDPMNAMLDITAAYRVNTNLTDLDESFSTDRDLARTNVPVDAMLMVTGNLQHPDINFDIQLPTLTQDVERKVKSIISTDDMMSRQIIYLLALSRFYTPEYMGSSSNGGELAAVASTTLSSQLSNMLGQLTDKFSVAPTIRSDKGDFSDLEVDVALSSRLLNNRLLINGNFGYRDPSTSHTTFVGDFDVEYLLSRGGNLRLKAYNHFNDQNYYLRQALTTQGLGVVYRREFDNPFSFLRRKKKKSDNTVEEAVPADKTDKQ